MKVAAKFFAGRFACGSSVTGGDEIVIQGDVKDDLFDVIPEKWPQVPLAKRTFSPDENSDLQLDILMFQNSVCSLSS